MKTFFNIEIEGLGDPFSTRIQSTKFHCVDKRKGYGYYRTSRMIRIDNYHVDIVLALTYDVEMGGTITHPIKQKRYHLHAYYHTIYCEDYDGMLHSQPSSMGIVIVSIEEEDVQPCNCTISVGNK